MVRSAQLRGLALAAASIAIVVACSNPVGPGPSSVGASPTPSSVASAGTGGAETPEAAAALVLATDPRFSGIGPVDPNVIGACCSWSVAPSDDGWTVTIEIGWGDCPAGCIDRHHWVYGVTRAGAVSLLREDGPPLPAGVPPPSGDQTDLVGIRGVASAGPTCPVQRPNDPNCVPRPVVGATIHVIDETGTEVALLETDATGAFSVTLPPGRYQVRADPVEGLMVAPDPIVVEVSSGLAPVDLQYDTGIR